MVDIDFGEIGSKLVGDRGRTDKDLRRIQKESGRDKERAKILEPKEEEL